MEVETADGRVGQVVASPRGGKWLVQLHDGRERRYREVVLAGARGGWGVLETGKPSRECEAHPKQ